MMIAYIDRSVSFLMVLSAVFLIILLSRCFPSGINLLLAIAYNPFFGKLMLYNYHKDKDSGIFEQTRMII